MWIPMLAPASMKMWWQPSPRRFGFADADVIVADVRVIGAGSNCDIDLKNCNPITYTMLRTAIKATISFAAILFRMGIFLDDFGLAGLLEVVVA